MRVVVLNRSFHRLVGGVEAQSLWLATQLSLDGHRVGVASWDTQYPTSPFEVGDGLDFFPLGTEDPQSVAKNSERIARHLRLRSTLKSYGCDVVIAYQQGAALSALLATRGTPTRVVAAERNSPKLFDYVKDGRRRRKTMHLLGAADSVVVQWERFRDLYPRRVQSRICAIPNPVMRRPVNIAARSRVPQVRRLIAVGRLSFQKNFEDLVRGLSIFNEATHNPVRCTIVGTGENCKSLRELISQVNQDAYINLEQARTDWIEDIHEYSALISTSRWEGFPNVVAEALASGVPVLGFAACDGVADLVQDGVNGMLAPGQASGMAVRDLIDRWFSDAASGHDWASASRNSVSQFDADKIYHLWVDLLQSLVGTRR